MPNCKMKSNFHTLIAIHVFKQIKTNSDCSSPFKEEQGADNTKYVNKITFLYKILNLPKTN